MLGRHRSPYVIGSERLPSGWEFSPLSFWVILMPIFGRRTCSLQVLGVYCTCLSLVSLQRLLELCLVSLVAVGCAVRRSLSQWWQLSNGRILRSPPQAYT